ncbi:MAG: DUF167 domain-containing protein [Candidatus Hydrogenedentota bacterium]
MEPSERKTDDVLLKVRVQPRASRDQVVLGGEGPVRVALTAPPAQGKANKALLNIVARQLGVRKSAVSLESGMKSRDKTLRVAGLSAEEIRRRLA